MPVIDIIERGLDDIGLLDAPGTRFVVVAGLTALALNISKPSALYFQSGKPKPWTLTDPKAPQAVPLDWKALSAFVGVLSVLLV